MRIALYGATGFTGRRTAHALARLGAEPVLVARRPDAVAALAAELGVESREAEARREDLRRAFAGARVVVSCAGPFGRIGQPVAEAALDVGAHYLDSTGEAPFMRWVYEALDVRARSAGVCAIPAGGFDCLPADCALTLLAARVGPPTRLDVVYELGGTASAGTRRSALDVVRDGAFVVEGGRIQAARPFDRQRRLELDGRRRRALRAPLSDPLIAAQRFPVEHAASWVVLAAPAAALLRAASPVVAPTLRLPLLRPALERVLAALGHVDEGRLAQAAFRVRVEAMGRGGRQMALELSGRDPYRLTAEALALRAVRLASGLAPRPGARTPAEGLDAAETLAALEVVVREVEG